MSSLPDLTTLRFDDALTEPIRGKRVLVLGAGSPGGLGQTLALTAGLNGAEAVGLHFYRSYVGGLETVEAINKAGGNAFPCQADLTNTSDVWSLRGHVIRSMGGLPPDLVICNSGLAERGYRLGRPPRSEGEESPALRRARVRQAFVDNLADTTAVLDTKTNGFCAISHLWAGEAQHHQRPVQLVYVSSRQAIDPGPGVPGYCLANWAILWLPRILSANLGSGAEFARAVSVVLPFVRTHMTQAYTHEPRFWQRWQPRMLEPHEVADSLLRLLHRPARELNDQVYQLNIDRDEEEQLRATWCAIRLKPLELNLPWSSQHPHLLTD